MNKRVFSSDREAQDFKKKYGGSVVYDDVAVVWIVIGFKLPDDDDE